MKKKLFYVKFRSETRILVVMLGSDSSKTPRGTLKNAADLTDSKGSGFGEGKKVIL